MNKAIRLFSALLVISCLPVFAQNLRTELADLVRIPSPDDEAATIILHYNDAVAILYPENPVFIQGMEFELRIPKAFYGLESSIAWSVYSNLSPQPSKHNLDYAAKLVSTQPLPSRVSMNLILPIVERHGITSGPFARIIPTVIGEKNFPLIFKLSPIGKGISPAMEKAEFKLILRPVLGDEGALKLSVVFPDGAEPVIPSVFIDDKKTDYPQELILLRKGPRVLRVKAEGYKEEILTLSMEPGKIVSANISLVPNQPIFIIRVPAGALVSLNGHNVEPDLFGGFAVEPGEHTISIKLGDYSMSRKITAQRGKVYNIVINVEMDIRSNP
ncbi:hypothetical protein MASR2M29_11630 [Spirochaetota bacterium]